MAERRGVRIGVFGLLAAGWLALAPEAAWAGGASGAPGAVPDPRAVRTAAEAEALRLDLARWDAAHPGGTPVTVPPPPPPRPTSIASPTATWTTPSAYGAPVAAPAFAPPAVARTVEEPVDPAASHSLGVGGLRWGGYMTLRFEAISNRNSFFDLHRLILKFDGPITSHVAIEGEIEYEHGGISDEIEGEIVLEFLHVTFPLSDAFVPKLGAMLIPFGRFNLWHDDPINDFTNRPFTARYMVPTGFSQPGIGVEGAIPIGRCHVISYDVALTNGFEDRFLANQGVREARQPWDEDNNEQKQAWGRVGWTVHGAWLDWFDAGVSGTWSKYDDDGDDDIVGWGVDFLARKGPVELKGEYLEYDYERGPGDPADAIQGQSALWLEAGLHFMPPFLRCRRGVFATETSHFTLAGRWQQMDLDDRVTGRTFEDDVEAIGVALNYRLTERTVFRVDHTWYEAKTADDRTELTFSFSTYF